jgi:single-strand DNA-binding protein
MRGLNRVTLIGTLGRDSEVRNAGGGKVTGLSLAVSRRAKKDGEWTEETVWFRVVCWDKLAETAEKYLKKGDRVFVEGQLRPRKYTGRDGGRAKRGRGGRQRLDHALRPR